MMADIKRKVPNLRFKGFTDDWEQRKLGDEYKHIGNAFVGTASPYYTQNGYFYLESNNIKNGQINHDHEVFINESFYHKQLNKLLHTGDLVMVQSGHVGDTAVITEKYNGTAAHALIMFRKPKNNMLSFFLNSFFQSSNAKNRIDVLAIGNTIRHILASDMKKFVVYLPDNKEKGEVAELFLELQKLIALQQRKLDLLKQFKKGLLQKMFADKDSKRPVLRFKGFHDDWEQRRLGDYLSIPTKEPITDINELKLMTLKLNLEGLVLTANRETLKLGATKYYKRHEGQLLYGKQNFFHGSIALIPQEAEGYATSGDVPALDISNINSKYLVDYISRPSYFKTKEALANGTGSKRIHEKTLLNFKIVVPSLEEQKAISDFITNYTNLIALHQRKQNHLKLFKKSLLQQMFM